MKRKRKPRVIDLLRKTYPGEWKYLGAGEWDGPGFGVFALRLPGGRIKYLMDVNGGASPPEPVPALVGYYR